MKTAFDLYTLACIAIFIAVIAWRVYEICVDSIICNLSQGSHDASVAEQKLDIIESESEVDNITELPYMRTCNKNLWPVVDEFEFKAQMILGEASARKFKVDWNTVN